MKWSQLRRQTLDNLCPELRQRIDFHVAIYRHRRHGDLDRGWITVDGQEIISCSCLGQILNPLTGSNDTFWEERRRRSSSCDLNPVAMELGVYSKSEFITILHQFLNADPQAMLHSPVPLARALAIADRRIGRRTLAGFPVGNEKDPVVLRFYSLRQASLVPGSPEVVRVT